MSIDESSIEVLKKCAEKKSPVFFSSNGCDIVFQTIVLKAFDSKMILKNGVQPRYISSVVNSKEFYLQSNMLRFVSESIESNGCDIIFPFENMRVIEETRQAERFPFETTENVFAEFVNPMDEETTIKHPIMDMSSTGISIKVNPDSQLYSSGRQFPDLQVRINEQNYFQTKGTIVYRRPFFNLQGNLFAQVGIKFENPVKYDHEKKSN